MHLQTVITGESKEEVTPKIKKKAKRLDKWKKGAGKSDKEGGEVGAVAEVDIRLLSALLTVSSTCLKCRIAHLFKLLSRTVMGLQMPIT